MKDKAIVCKKYIVKYLGAIKYYDLNLSSNSSGKKCFIVLSLWFLCRFECFFLSLLKKYFEMPAAKEVKTEEWKCLAKRFLNACSCDVVQSRKVETSGEEAVSWLNSVYAEVRQWWHQDSRVTDVCSPPETSPRKLSAPQARLLISFLLDCLSTWLFWKFNPIICCQVRLLCLGLNWTFLKNNLQMLFQGRGWTSCILTPSNSVILGIKIREWAESTLGTSILCSCFPSPLHLPWARIWEKKFILKPTQLSWQ